MNDRDRYLISEASVLLRMVIANLRNPILGGISEDQMLAIEEYLDRSETSQTTDD